MTLFGIGSSRCNSDEVYLIRIGPESPHSPKTWHLFRIQGRKKQKGRIARSVLATRLLQFYIRRAKVPPGAPSTLPVMFTGQCLVIWPPSCTSRTLRKGRGHLVSLESCTRQGKRDGSHCWVTHPTVCLKDGNDLESSIGIRWLLFEFFPQIIPQPCKVGKPDLTYSHLQEKKLRPRVQ